MGNITILSYTPKPITFIGKVAGICYNSNTDDDVQNYRRGLRNIADNHGRTFEFPDVVMLLDGYSARVMRELYTHIIGTSRLQASTRYIDYSEDFDFYTPPSLIDNPLYRNTVFTVREAYSALLKQGYKKEDVSNLFPLCMHTKVVLKINMRALLHMAEVRECSRAYIEFRELMKDMKDTLAKLDSEWEYITQIMSPRCGSCTEVKNCKL